VRVCVRAFARLREILCASERSVDVPDGARIEDLWALLCQENAALGRERNSTRAARNGRLAAFDERLCDGDDVAFLPPVSGG